VFYNMPVQTGSRKKKLATGVSAIRLKLVRFAHFLLD